MSDTSLAIPASFSSWASQIHYEIPWVNEFCRKLNQPIIDQLQPMFAQGMGARAVTLPQQKAVTDAVANNIQPFSEQWSAYLDGLTGEISEQVMAPYMELLHSVFPETVLTTATTKRNLVEADRAIRAGAVPDHILQELEIAYDPQSSAMEESSGTVPDEATKHARRVWVFLVAVALWTGAIVGSQTIPSDGEVLNILHETCHKLAWGIPGAGSMKGAEMFINAPRRNRGRDNQ